MTASITARIIRTPQAGSGEPCLACGDSCWLREVAIKAKIGRHTVTIGRLCASCEEAR